MDRGAWQVTVQRVTKSQTGLKWLSAWRGGENSTGGGERGRKRNKSSISRSFFAAWSTKTGIISHEPRAWTRLCGPSRMPAALAILGASQLLSEWEGQGVSMPVINPGHWLGSSRVESLQAPNTDHCDSFSSADFLFYNLGDLTQTVMIRKDCLSVPPWFVSGVPGVCLGRNGLWGVLHEVQLSLLILP